MSSNKNVKVLIPKYFLLCLFLGCNTGAPVSDKYKVQHEELLKMNRCNFDDDCSAVYGGEGLECFYFVSKNSLNDAKEILKSSGIISKVTCDSMNIASGVICSDNKCTVGEGKMVDIQHWDK